MKFLFHFIGLIRFLAELLLQKLGLVDILREELHRLNEQEKNLRNFVPSDEPKVGPKPGTSSVVPPPPQPGPSRIKSIQFVEMDENYDEVNNLTKKKEKSIKSHFKGSKKRTQISSDDENDGDFDIERRRTSKKAKTKKAPTSFHVISSSDEEKEKENNKVDSNFNEEEEESIEKFIEIASQEIMMDVEPNKKPSPVLSSRRLKTLASQKEEPLSYSQRLKKMMKAELKEKIKSSSQKPKNIEEKSSKNNSNKFSFVDKLKKFAKTTTKSSDSEQENQPENDLSIEEDNDPFTNHTEVNEIKEKTSPELQQNGFFSQSSLILSQPPASLEPTPLISQATQPSPMSLKDKLLDVLKSSQKSSLIHSSQKASQQEDLDDFDFDL